MSRPRPSAALLTLLVTAACGADAVPSNHDSTTTAEPTPPGSSEDGGSGADTPGGARDGAMPTAAGNEDASPQAGKTPPESAACSAEVLLTEVNNYSYSSQLEISVVNVKPDTNLTFDWSDLSRDFMGHDVDPLEDVDFVLAVLWNLTTDELVEQMNADLLNQADIVAPAMFYTENDVTSVELLQAQLFERPLEPDELLPRFNAEQYDPEQHTYSLMVRTGTMLVGTGTRMIQLFKLDPESERTTVNLTNDSTKLMYQVDLQSAEPILVPPETAGVSLDWGEDTAALATNALGNEFKVSRVSEVFVAYYDESIEELEQQFLDRHLIVEHEWRHTFSEGSSVTLDELTDEAGQPFPGIDGNGTWMLGLICGECSNPAPWYLTRLQPCSL